MENSDFWKAQAWSGHETRYLTNSKIPQADNQKLAPEQIDLVGDYLKLPEALQNP